MINGKHELISRVVRTESNAILILQLHNFTEQNGLRYPCNHTQFMLLSASTASKSNILKGLDKSKEKARRAFIDLSKMIDQLCEYGMPNRWDDDLHNYHNHGGLAEDQICPGD